jgi:hypothetical protein
MVMEDVMAGEYLRALVVEQRGAEGTEKAKCWHRVGTAFPLGREGGREPRANR